MRARASHVSLLSLAPYCATQSNVGLCCLYTHLDRLHNLWWVWVFVAWASERFRAFCVFFSNAERACVWMAGSMRKPRIGLNVVQPSKRKAICMSMNRSCAYPESRWLRFARWWRSCMCDSRSIYPFLLSFANTVMSRPPPCAATV